MSDNPYVKRDLIDHANLESVNWSSTWDRAQAVKESLPTSARTTFKRIGSYQGEYALVVDFDDCLWVATGYYGSCSYCDAFQGDKQHETERLLREAYCFESEEDLAEWALTGDALEMTYGDAIEALRNALDELGVSIE